LCVPAVAPTFLNRKQASKIFAQVLFCLFVCSFVYLFVYSRCSTDILLGKNCGLMTLHVGSGVDSLEDIRLWESCESEEQQKLVPDFYAEDLGSLLPFAQELLAQKSSTSS
jgi:ribonucleotide monophosphatase NagD (HAD superfamily)